MSSAELENIWIRLEILHELKSVDSMELNKVKIGLRVKITRLEDTKGMMIKRQHLDVRTVGARGEVIGYVPGHGGDVWWIRHNDGAVGAYVFNEFELEN